MSEIEMDESVWLLKEELLYVISVLVQHSGCGQSYRSSSAAATHRAWEADLPWSDVGRDVDGRARRRRCLCWRWCRWRWCCDGRPQWSNVFVGQERTPKQTVRNLA
jgi:hypothetical protein